MQSAQSVVVFEHLKNILQSFSLGLAVVIDKPDQYYLNTHFIMKNKQPMYFGSVKINKNYVSYHLMPVYVFPELVKTLSPQLKRRMQGKSCFNFKEYDKTLFDELMALTKNGHKEYQIAGYL